MLIIKITPNENGSHDYTDTTFLSALPEGWAIVPDGTTLENFPFGEVTAEEISGIMTVTNWVPGEIPEPEEPAEPEMELSVWDELDAAYQEGVDSV